MTDNPQPEVPLRNIRDIVGPTIEYAIDEIAPNEGLMWDIAWFSQDTGFISLLMLMAPSPFIGQSLVVGGVVEAPKLSDPIIAGMVIRTLLDKLRDQQAALRKMPKL